MAKLPVRDPPPEPEYRVNPKLEQKFKIEFWLPTGGGKRGQFFLKTNGEDLPEVVAVLRELADVAERAATVNGYRGSERSHDQKQLLIQAAQALFWCSGAQDFQEGGVAREGWKKLEPLMEQLRQAVQRGVAVREDP